MAEPRSQLSPARLILAGALFVAVAGCGGDHHQAARQLLALRPVLGSPPPPCPAEGSALAGPVTASSPDPGPGPVCLRLGAPIVDATDVRSVAVGQTPSGEQAVSLVLGRSGSDHLDRFAQSHLGKRLAIVVEGAVVSAPVVRFESFAGRVQITGLPAGRVDEFVSRLGRIIPHGAAR